MFLSNITDSGGVPLSVDFDSPVDYLIFIFQLLFAAAAVLVAGPVVITICSTRGLRLQNRFIFMLNTSICDTLFDRYFAVCHPFIYTRFITRAVVITANIYCWLHVYAQSIITSFVPLSRAIQLYFYTIIGLQIIVFTKVVMTIKLYVIARVQLERDPPSAERESKKESLRIIIFVVISFLVLWCPSFFNVVLRLAFGQGITFRNQATNLFAILARFNAVCTPAVYLWGSPALRKAVVRTVWGRVCPRCKKSKRIHVSSLR
ncbi:hypothetical protein ABVT39_007928 [Epinephelus coioides]